MIENSGTPADTQAALDTDSSFVDLDADTGASEANAETGDEIEDGDAPTDVGEPDDGDTDDKIEDAEAPAKDADAKDEGEDEDDGEDEPEPEADKKKKLSGSQRQKARIAHLEAQLEAATKAASGLPVGDAAALAAAVEKEIGPAPKESDYENFLDFERDRTAYELDKRQVTRALKSKATDAASARDAAHAEKQSQLMADHGERLKALEKALPGSRDKVAAIAKLPVQGHVAELILDSDKSALLALHIAETPSKLEELNGMSEARAAREIGRLEAKLSLPKPKTATKAPAPLGTVRGAATAANPDAQLSSWLSKTYGAGR
jgi:hypothetical protein